MVTRRTVLLSLGLGATGGGVVLGSGAFSSVEAERTARIQVADDADALLALEATESSDGRYVDTDEAGTIVLQFTGTDRADGLGPNSRYVFEDVFTITNQGTRPVAVSATVEGLADAASVEAFVLVAGETGDPLSSGGVELSVGETLPVGVEVETAAESSDPVELDVTIEAGERAGTTPSPTVESATITDEYGDDRADVGVGDRIEVTADVVSGSSPLASVTADASAFGVSDPVELGPTDDGGFAGRFSVAEVAADRDTAAVGVTATDAADATASATSNHLGLVQDGAARWAERAVWRTSGSANDFPGQVVYPSDSLGALQTLSSFDRDGDVDGAGLAASAVRLQDPERGGCYAFWGDSLGPWLPATHATVVLVDEYGLDIDEDAAVTFLAEDMQTDAGGFAPRYAYASDRPISARMESTFLALDALRRLDALDAETRERALEYVEAEQQPDGGWRRSTATGDASVFGTYYALRTLDLLDELDDETAEEADQYLLSMQVPSGGFRSKSVPVGCGPGALPAVPNCTADPEVTVRATSRAILGFQITGYLAENRDVLREQHADWIQLHRRDDPDDPRFRGGYDNYPVREPPVTDPRTNTRLALSALDALEADFDPEPGLDYLVRCQHAGSKGFGAVPSFVTSLENVPPAVRTLQRRDRPDSIPADALAATLSRQQTDEGAIRELDASGDPTVSRTGWALSALARLDRLSAVDAGAAVDFIASRQRDSGGFSDSDSEYANATVRTTAVAVRAVDVAGGLDSIDTGGAVSFLADLQDGDGSISGQGDDYSVVRDTRLAVDALSRLGRLDAVDREAAREFLLGYAGDAETWVVELVGHAVVGLATLDALDAVEAGATAAELDGRQLDSGGFVPRWFFTGGSALERHAAAVEGIETLRDELGSAGSTAVESDDEPEATHEGTGVSASGSVPGRAVTAPPEREVVRLADAGWVSGRSELAAYWSDPP